MSETPKLTALETSDGYCYMDLSNVSMIGNRFQKGDHPPSRRIVQGMKDLTTYIMDTPFNYAALKHLLPVNAAPWPETGAKPKAKKPLGNRKAAKNTATEED